jgi:hypothetical protein
MQPGRRYRQLHPIVPVGPVPCAPPVRCTPHAKKLAKRAGRAWRSASVHQMSDGHSLSSARIARCCTCGDVFPASAFERELCVAVRAVRSHSCTPSIQRGCKGGKRLGHEPAPHSVHSESQLERSPAPLRQQSRVTSCFDYQPS